MEIIWLGIVAGAVTSVGFLPQIVKGFKTKRLDDVSYWMPIVLAIGMMLWLLYGIVQYDFAIIAANVFGIGCNLTIVIMKRFYSTNTNGHKI